MRRAVSVGAYEGLLRELVRRFKFGRRRALARPLGVLLSERVIEEGLRADLVVPVPLDRARERRRGFNQAELVAAEVARRLGLPLARRALVRVRRTPSLYRLGAAERREALDGAFAAARAGVLAGRRVLLVDDVLTSGATLSACAKALRAAGARAVVAACVARRQTSHRPALGVLPLDLRVRTAPVL